MGIVAKQITRQSREDQRWASLISLAKRCPVGERNPEDCPLFSIRKMKPMARLNWFKGLPEEDLGFIAAYHHVCMNLKLVENRAIKSLSADLQ
jgi:hypothetical protein